jgi:hypothetical protein
MVFLALKVVEAMELSISALLDYNRPFDICIKAYSSSILVKYCNSIASESIVIVRISYIGTSVGMPI